ncbi:ferredoxin--NADP reductase [Shewanella cyperi]|uniref:ferredoxin--NADP reductase n=1 Tax=Shewanella cyperi TaxID=2814292 RepID=UPI001A941C65|nr:ferredoxin--NADP reductase [Shewanella cyperi]QSX40201.1 ferredoxin--NADP reductase [Shewanella cyperi]
MWVEGTVISRIDWTDTLFSLRIRAPLAPFIAGQFIKLSRVLDDKRIARAYSLVNPPGSDFLEILAVTVEEGQLSPRLQELKPGDRIEVTATAAGFMTLNELPKDIGKHLWMLATGTAIGPFVSMLATAEPWDRFERLVLVYGVRHRADLAYLDELKALQAKYPDKFSLILSVTREAVDGALQCRIPEALASGELERLAALALSPTDSQVMICGNPDMLASAQQLLLERGLTKNLRRAPGNITVEKYW